jgi:hypothetical protein
MLWPVRFSAGVGGGSDPRFGTVSCAQGDWRRPPATAARGYIPPPTPGALS